MAGIALFHFTARDSPVHRLDPRVKLLLLVGLSLAAFFLPGPALAGVGVTAGAGYVGSGTRFGETLRRAWLFLLIALFVVGSRAIVLMPFGEGPSVSIDPPGLFSGLDFAVRLLLLVLLANLFVATTSRGTLIDVIHWLAVPFSSRAAARLALMAGLTLSFVAVIHEESRQARDALAARGGSARRHPFTYAKVLGRELVRKTTGRAEEIADALYTRGYCDVRTRELFRLQPRDLAVLVTVAAVMVLSALSPLLWNLLWDLLRHR